MSGDGNGAPPALGAGPGTEPAIEPRRAPDDDPLGPPEARPPIDLSQLDRPLGPAPYLPGRSAADAGGVDTASPASPTRLPRRGEAQTWVSPAARGQAADPPRVVPDADPPPRARTPRPAPRQVAPKPGMPSGTPGSAATAGPPALPLIILVAVVAVLALGVAWLVVNGDDGGEPASDRRASEAAAGPSEVEVNEVPDGIQVTWTGDADASYIVTVLSGEAPPEALPATIGTSALVPNVEGAAAGPRCFTVTAADEAGAATGDATSPVCTDGATPDQMQQG